MVYDDKQKKEVAIMEIIKEMQVGKINASFDALKTAVMEKVAVYEGVIYTEETVKVAKEDRAYLNKQAQELDAIRKTVKAEFLAPYTEFENKVKEIKAIIDNASAGIDAQVKTFEAEAKERKRAEVENLWKEKSDIDINRVFDPKWLNASASMSKIGGEMDKILEEFNNVRAALGLAFGGEILEKCYQKYIDTRNMNEVVEYGNDLKEVANVTPAFEESDETVVKGTDEGFVVEKKVVATYKITATPTELLALESYMAKEGYKWQR